MHVSWRRTALYGIALGIISIGIGNYLKLRTEAVRLRKLTITDDIMLDNAVARGYFYFEDRQAIVLAKTNPVLIKPAEGYFRNSGSFVFLPADITVHDIHAALQDSAYYLESRVTNRGIPAGAQLVLKRDEWDAAPLPTPQVVAKVLARYFSTNGITPA